MSYCGNDSPKSFFALLRGLFRGRLRTVALGVCLLAGAMSGVPIPPEEIERHMQNMSKAKIAQVLEREHQPGGDPPAEGQCRCPYA